MISNLNPSAEAFLANMQRVQRNVEEASRQVSSGKRVNVASDAPGEVGAILQLHADQLRNTQIQANLTLAKTEADAADNALNSATKIMDRARVLGTQGANFALDASARLGLATEVESLQAQLVSITRTSVQGRYVFSGDRDDMPAYDLDLTQATGVIALSPTTATRRVEDPGGGSFAVTKGAGEIFDARNPDGSPAAENVFAALNNLRTVLTSNDVDQISATVGALQVAASHLNIKQAFYGSVQGRIQDAANYSGTYDTQLRAELSQKEDADVAAAALALSQGTMQLQAGFQMEAKMPRTTLFEYIG